mmetsp:Transcript_14238/g.34595  ORF Transcript_14238/g.34595 Transcript_14238/m.34595 type:complete len:213 (-) Transcript_14238:506-1144(-)
MGRRPRGGTPAASLRRGQAMALRRVWGVAAWVSVAGALRALAGSPVPLAHWLPQDGLLGLRPGFGHRVHGLMLARGLFRRRLGHIHDLLRLHQGPEEVLPQRELGDRAAPVAIAYRHLEAGPPAEATSPGVRHVPQVLISSEKPRVLGVQPSQGRLEDSRLDLLWLGGPAIDELLVKVRQQPGTLGNHRSARLSLPMLVKMSKCHHQQALGE